jgi:hypothetical protein
MCIGDDAAATTCVPTHSLACSEPNMSEATCNAHEGCTWTNDACTTTTPFDTCMAEASNGQSACEAAGEAAGHCTFRTVGSSLAGSACMNAYVNGDDWAGTPALTCPAYALDRPTGM